MAIGVAGVHGTVTATTEKTATLLRASGHEWPTTTLHLTVHATTANFGRADTAGRKGGKRGLWKGTAPRQRVDNTDDGVYSTTVSTKTAAAGCLIRSLKHRTHTAENGTWRWNAQIITEENETALILNYLYQY